MRLKHWVVFGVVQSAGFMSVYIFNGPCAGLLLLSGWSLLLPGCLVSLALPHAVENLPQWAGDAVFGVLVVCANALFWYLVAGIKREMTTSG
jgi:hypothetical protein